MGEVCVLCAVMTHMMSAGSVNVVDIFNAITGNWSTAALSEARWSLAATSLPNEGLAIFAGGGPSKAVDIFNSITGNWSTAVLSEDRRYLAATSLPNQGLAIFAGGGGTSCDCYCDDCREGCGVRGMWGRDACVGGVWCVECASNTHCCVQVTVMFLPKLWTSSIRQHQLLQSRLLQQLPHQYSVPDLFL